MAVMKAGNDTISRKAVLDLLSRLQSEAMEKYRSAKSYGLDADASAWSSYMSSLTIAALGVERL